MTEKNTIYPAGLICSSCFAAVGVGSRVNGCNHTAKSIIFEKCMSAAKRNCEYSLFFFFTCYMTFMEYVSYANIQFIVPFLSFTVHKFNLPKPLVFITVTYILCTVGHAAKWRINYCIANVWILCFSSPEFLCFHLLQCSRTKGRSI